MCSSSFMSKHLKITILIILFTGLVLPQIASAGLVPCGRTPGEGVPIEETQPCTLCHVFILIQRLLAGISIALFSWAGLFILIGGFLIMTAAGSADKIGQGKRMITYAIIGVIIALGSWLIINTVMNAIVDPEVMPWPWNKIACGVPPPPSAERFCVCETPVYDLDPNIYPNQASVIGENIKVTRLDSNEACQKECVSNKSSTYCPSTLKQSQAELYCASESNAKIETTCAVKLSRDPQCQISSGQCWSDPLECAATLTAAAPQFNSSYVKRCFLNGQSLCSYIEWANGATYCPKKDPAPCPSSKPYTLYRFAEEKPIEQLNALACSERYYGNTGYVCRLDCQYDKCIEEPTNVCDEVKTFPCFFEDKFNCKNMVERQERNACPALEELLKCLATDEKYKLLHEYRVITSISDNSPPTGALSGCFRNWLGQCLGNIDSCKGTCCGHSKCSLHYGGKAPIASEGPTDCPGSGSTACRDCSWAVDFAIYANNPEVTYNYIKSHAEDCAKKLGEKIVDVINEGDHIHVELEGVAKYYRCK